LPAREYTHGIPISKTVFRAVGLIAARRIRQRIAKPRAKTNNHRFRAANGFALMSLTAIHILIVCIVIGVLMIGKVLILPAMLRAWLGVKRGAEAPATWQDRVQLRYQNLKPAVWIRARYKLRLDPMFRELPEFVKAVPSLRTAMDLGCGHGVAGCWLLESFPELNLYGIEPNPKRVRAATSAFGERGHVFQGGAPDFEAPTLPERLDAVFAIDMIHFLSDAALDLTLRRIRARLDEGSFLFLRAPLLPAGFGSILWNLDRIERGISGAPAYFRTVEQIREPIIRAGFQITLTQFSGDNPELFWFIAAASSHAGHPVKQNDDDAQKHDGNVSQDQRDRVAAGEFIPPL
jgi:hypothetical protein